jgi:PadR family transcriptional regulator
MSKPNDLIQGTLDLLILKTIALGPMHGWAIAKRIQQVSKEVLQVTQGALYPALHRLEQQGWVRGAWRESESGREAKFYGLTKAGRAQLDKELEQWHRLSSAVVLVINAVQEVRHEDRALVGRASNEVSLAGQAAAGGDGTR